MLNISDAMVASAVKAYFEAPHDFNYYLNDHNPPGRWGGKLAEEFGLHGLVEQEHFDRLADGLHPLTGDDLVLKRQENRRSANDITMSAPKALSLLYLHTRDPRLLTAFVESCDWVMGEMEEDAGARVRMGGADYDRKTGNWAYAGWLQFDSRPDSNTHLPVIQIHRHHTVFNLTRGPEEQRIKALQIGMVKDNADYWMPLFHNDLAKRIRTLGYGVEKDPKTGIVGFGIAGIPREMIDRFSPRRATIKAFREAALKQLNSPESRERIGRELGTTDQGQIEKAIKHRVKQLQGEIAKLTRLHKQKNLSLEDLWKVWDRQLTPKDHATLEKARGKAGWSTTNAEAAGYAKEDLFYRRSVIEHQAEKKLLIEALRYGVGSVDAEGLKKELVKQGVMYKGEEATTKQTWEEEGRIIDFTREGRGTMRPLGGGSEPSPHQHVVTLSAERQGKILTEQQRAALTALVTSTSRVNIVDAGQGTGKTTLLEEFGKVLTRARQPAIWLGTTHTAVEQLQKENLPAMTLAHFLKSEKEHIPGARIILDEASMLAHRDAYKLFMLAKEKNWRVDLIGDTKQYKSPVAGAPMELLTRFAGIKPITMTKTMRQQGRLKQAMESIREGNELKGHDILNELGMVHELPPEELAKKAAELYLGWSTGAKYVPVISPTHAQADEIAARIREGLRKRGDLKGEDHTIKRLVNLGWSDAKLADAKKHGAEGVILTRYGAFEETTQQLAVGDLVKTTMGCKTKDGHQLKGGQKHSIKAFTKDGNPVLDNDREIDKDWGGLVQRYVSTGQGAQGVTAKNAIVVYGTPSLAATRQEGFYVPVSRVTQEVAVLTDSNDALRQAIQRRESRKSATQLLGRKKTKRKSLMEYIRGVQRRYKLLQERILDTIPGLAPERNYEQGFAR